MVQAIIFDLFGTLIPAESPDARDAASHRSARELAVDPFDFAALVRATFDERMKGSLGGLSATYGELARRLGSSPTAEQVSKAVEHRLAFARELLAVRTAEPILRSLMKAGFRLGVATDCSAETPAVWSSSWLHQYFDHVAFSCDLGVRKPDPLIDLAVVEALVVSPSDCIFVGDGGSQELTGARALGMEAVMLVDPSEAGVYRDNQEIDWRGTTIGSLAEIMVRLDIKSPT